MNHYAWTHLAGGGRNTKIGLYHSSTTGHLMIYAGKRIVTIDFKVLDSKEYTFFIDEELCKIKLERRGDEMYYSFEIDKKADTPLNRIRWAREKKHLRQMLLSFGIIALLVTAVVIWSKADGRDRDADKLLTRKGIETYGKVVSISPKNKGEILFNFIAGDKAQTGRLKGHEPTQILPPNKFPLEEGDEFIVRYVPERPSLNRIYLMRPTSKQIDIYRTRTLARLSRHTPSITSERAECILDIAHETDGLDGWAHIYFQKTRPDENPSHNSETFQKFFNSYLFQGAIKKRCPPE